MSPRSSSAWTSSARSTSSPTQSGELPYFTRPVLAPTPKVTAVTAVEDLDELMDSAKCSCNAGDDNPH
ncbi:hypothetical protein OG785_03455 [Streptomyces sp. NBC_00006]|uniref:hypothetical protein n=1 Tax=Streptomyces sp. NBC_00006 TaxID=2975619 RepID=UPI002256BC44|nr:hypothetical protein [Streptomyces sp. NBC_00006]MCX5529626.1 hypothetical protein [Streptomyces sp. NBC_00006]